jgi:hypothetical protein
VAAGACSGHVGRAGVAVHAGHARDAGVGGGEVTAVVRATAAVIGWPVPRMLPTSMRA